MDAMKEALKKKMMMMQEGEGAPASDGLMAEEEVAETPGESDEDLEMAPSLDGSPLASEEGLETGGLESIDPKILLQILQAIGGDASLINGRDPKGLGERAAVGAKEKMASMMKK